MQANAIDLMGLFLCKLWPKDNFSNKLILTFRFKYTCVTEWTTSVGAPIKVFVKKFCYSSALYFRWIDFNVFLTFLPCLPISLLFQHIKKKFIIVFCSFFVWSKFEYRYTIYTSRQYGSMLVLQRILMNAVYRSKK